MVPITITDVRAVPGDSGFLIDNGKTAILYDSGFAFTGFAVLENIRHLLGHRSLDYILLTHSHYDHVLGVASLLTAYPQAKVVAASHAAAVFARASAKATMRELNKRAADQQQADPSDHLVDNLRVDIPVQDGDVIHCGSLAFTVLALPGHTKCSVGYHLAENKLLLGTETLGVYFGNNTYLPSFLVGYQATLDAFHKVKLLDVESMLLPHYGVVDGDALRTYLRASEAVTRSTAQTILSMFRQDKTEEEILAYLKEKDYLDHVKPLYPIDAFLMNTRIMIEQVRKELL